MSHSSKHVPPNSLNLNKTSEMSTDISDVRFYDVPTLVFFLLLFIVVLLQFFTRYVFNFSFEWTEELARYLLIMLGFFGGIICVKKRSHIFLEFIYGYLSQQLTKLFMLISEALLSGFFLYCGWLAIELSNRTKNKMIYIDLPKSVVYYTVSLSCFIMGVLSLIHLIKIFRKPSHVLAKERLTTHSAEEI